MRNRRDRQRLLWTDLQQLRRLQRPELNLHSGSWNAVHDVEHVSR